MVASGSKESVYFRHIWYMDSGFFLYLFSEISLKPIYNSCSISDLFGVAMSIITTNKHHVL